MIANVNDKSTEEADVAIRIAHVNDISRVAAAYSKWGYGGGIVLNDTAWIAEVAGEVIGIVRIAPEHGTLVLRGMRIAEQWRRRRIGSRMLVTLGSWLNERECYCVPYTHLRPFYGQIGFVEISASAAPSFLRSRVVEYKRNSLDVVVMVRSARV
jgi:N-acetylglutamate synthase-like GNAT family acetyltransferase